MKRETEHRHHLNRVGKRKKGKKKDTRVQSLLPHKGHRRKKNSSNHKQRRSSRSCFDEKAPKVDIAREKKKGRITGDLRN